jgi:hypothetical protein
MAKEIEITKRKSAFLSPIGPWHKEHDFIEVTEWTNGEGWDITISDKQFSLHFTEYDALKKLIKHLEKSK